MKNSRVVKVILAVSGLILLGVGSATLFAPEAFLGTSGINLGGQASLFSEIRAAGGALLLSGILILSGIFIPRMTFTSMVIAIAMFLSYGVARILSMSVDGLPDTAIVGATVLEMVIAFAGIFALIRFREV